uniref:Uncharacterized protein n=1 Tax=Populus alba TaxID=43335 RepID=A0A4U5NNW5_POPAL|nr:hypothetical protein D5086_0000248960 [Populus alba]
MKQQHSHLLIFNAPSFSICYINTFAQSPNSSPQHRPPAVIVSTTASRNPNTGPACTTPRHHQRSQKIILEKGWPLHDLYPPFEIHPKRKNHLFSALNDSSSGCNPSLHRQMVPFRNSNQELSIL